MDRTTSRLLSLRVELTALASVWEPDQRRSGSAARVGALADAGAQQWRRSEWHGGGTYPSPRPSLEDDLSVPYTPLQNEYKVDDTARRFANALASATSPSERYAAVAAYRAERERERNDASD